MNEIIPLWFEQHQIRVSLDDNGNPWWVAKDVCEALGIQWKGNDSLHGIPEAWRGVRKFRTPLANQYGEVGEQEQELITINEPARYKLSFRSRKPQADRFTNWVAGDVLPSIRKRGAYVAPGADAEVAGTRMYLEQHAREIALKDQIIEEKEKRIESERRAADAERRTADAERARADTLEKLAAAQTKLVTAGVRISPQPGTRVYRERRRMTEDIRQRIIALDAQGLSHKEIAKQVDRSRGTVASVLRREARGKEVDNVR